MEQDSYISHKVRIAPSWKDQLADEFEKPYFRQLTHFLKKEYAEHTVYPPGKKIFRAFDECDFDHIKVVLIGQDPYHGVGQANGLCFSVHKNIRIPPSLGNIFKEIESDLGQKAPSSGELERWAQQGVLLLNSTLTVRASSPGSHQNKGWEIFTDAVIKKISQKRKHLVFLLWGAYAQKKGEVIDATKHSVLKAPHPSPFSADRGFFGCRHFSQANAYLEHHQLKTIAW